MRVYQNISSPIKSQKEHSEIPFIHIVNPRIIGTSRELCGDFEMCLSIPKYFNLINTKHGWICPQI